LNKLILFIICILAATELIAGSDYSVTIRDDNDISTYKDSVSKQEPAPVVVNTKLKEFLIQKLMDSELDAVQMYKYIQTFRISTPDSNYVFVAEIDEGPRGLQFYLFYFNQKRNMCSDYFNVNGYFMKNDEEGFKEWNGMLVDKPYISFKDVNNDGTNEIIFNRRAHNGTWNAVETIVIRILAELKIEKWFSYFSKELKGDDGETLVKRTLQKVEGNDFFLNAGAYNLKTGKFLGKMDDESYPITNVGK